MTDSGVHHPTSPSRILVTGGAGFVGSHFVRRWLANKRGPLLNLDKLTYAANPLTLKDVEDDPQYTLVHGDIADPDVVREAFQKARPDAVVHCAAESHVDRSIEQPELFVRTNVQGAYVLLDAALDYWQELDAAQQQRFRFLNVSTDEVFGEAAADQHFQEHDPFAPNSPYAASKAAAAHLARAYWRTYQLPVITTFASNNYGPYQFPEKLIPRAILAAIEEHPIPLYGDGLQERDWLHVEDHCSGLELILDRGQTGECYNVGGSQPIANRNLLEQLASLIDVRLERREGDSQRLIQPVSDRPGHDRRYALNCQRLRKLGWRPRWELATGLAETISWYHENSAWLASLPKDDYQLRRGVERKNDPS